MVNPRLLSSAPTSRGLAFDLIRSQGPISRVELAERTGLTQATMSNVVRQLMVDGLVVEAGRRESTGGKPRTLLSIDPLARFALGVQLGADAVTVVLTDLGGAMVGRLRTHGVYGEAPDAAVARIAAVVADFLGGLGVPAERVAGLGLVTPGPIDLRHGSIHGAPPLEAWAGFPLVERRHRGHRPARRPRQRRHRGGHRRVLGRLRRRLGGALHRLLRGGHRRGHRARRRRVPRGQLERRRARQVMSRAPGPFLSNTTVEKLAGPVGVALRARAAVAAGREAGFALTGLTDPYADFSVVATAAVHGDPLALELIRDSAEHLAAAVVSIANVLDLDSIVLAGPNLAIAGALYLEAVRRRVDEDFFARAAHGVSVELSAYVADAAAVGGAALVLQREIMSRSAGAAPAARPRPQPVRARQPVRSPRPAHFPGGTVTSSTAPSSSSSLTFPEPTATPLRGGPALRWGVIGTGEIAGDFTDALHAHTDQRVVAVSSRTLDKAERFAASHGVATAVEGQEALVALAEVDVVYVATPHTSHVPDALQAIAAGKHVLVEKPFATTTAEAPRCRRRPCGRCARDGGDVDAIRAAQHRARPAARRRRVRRRPARDGRRRPGRTTCRPAGRMADPALGGGALLDIGVYAVWFAQFAIGRPVDVRATGTTRADGVDLEAAIALRTAEGRVGTAVTSLLTTSPGSGTISGSTGTVRMLEHLVFPASFELPPPPARPRGGTRRCCGAVTGSPTRRRRWRLSSPRGARTRRCTRSTTHGR